MITCRVCERKVPALEGARCTRCRRLVCTDCLTDDKTRVCRGCATEPEPAEPAEQQEVPSLTVSAPGRAQRRRRPLGSKTVAALVTVLAGGFVFALLALVPPWRARTVLRRLRAAEGGQIEALGLRLEHAARGAPVAFAREMGVLPPEKRCAAIHALGRAGRVRTVPYLIREFERGNTETRAAASQALWEITGKEFGADPDAWHKWWRERE